MNGAYTISTVCIYGTNGDVFEKIRIKLRDVINFASIHFPKKVLDE